MPALRTTSRRSARGARALSGLLAAPLWAPPHLNGKGNMPDDFQELRRRVRGEVRHVTADIREVRDAGGRAIEGYAAVFNSESEDLGFIETLAPGCFARSLADPKSDAWLLYAHGSAD